MADPSLPTFDYAQARAAAERGAAAYISVGPIHDGLTPLLLYIAFKVEDDEGREHHGDITNQVATLYAMNNGGFDDAFPEVDPEILEGRRRGDC